jgi:hypothetical protein
VRDHVRGLRAWLLGPSTDDLPLLAAQAAAELPRHLLPRFWQALSQPALNANGKLDRRPLIDQPLSQADYIHASHTIPA